MDELYRNNDREGEGGEVINFVSTVLLLNQFSFLVRII